MKKIKYILGVLFIFFSFNLITFSANSSGTVNTSRMNPQQFANEHGYGLKTKGIIGKVYTKYSEAEIREIMAEYYKAVEADDQVKAAELKEKIVDNSEVVYNQVKGAFELNTLIKELKIHFENVPHKLTQLAIYLLGICTALEMIDFLLNNPTQFPLSPIARIIVKYILLRFLIGNWYDLLFQLDGLMKKIAISAAGGNLANISFGGDGLWDMFTQPLRDTITDTSWFKPVQKIFYLIAVIPAYIISALLVLDLFMSKLEATLITGFAIIVIPLAAWQKSGVGTVVNVLKTQFSKLMIFYFFLALWKRINPTISPLSFAMLDNKGFILLGKYTLILFALRMIIGKSIAIGSALFGGGAGMFSSGDVTRPLTSMGAKIIGLASLAIGGFGAINSYRAARSLKGAGNIGEKVHKAGRMASASRNSNSKD